MQETIYLVHGKCYVFPDQPAPCCFHQSLSADSDNVPCTACQKSHHVSTCGTSLSPTDILTIILTIYRLIMNTKLSIKNHIMLILCYFLQRSSNLFQWKEYKSQPWLTQTKIEFSHKQQSLSKPKNIKVFRTAILYDTGFSLQWTYIS